VFEERLRASVPERAGKVLSALREMRGGVLYRSDFGTRMRGEGQRWEAVHQLFQVQCRRLGLDLDERRGTDPPRPKPVQLDLFAP
jgi:hypothetical protein